MSQLLSTFLRSAVDRVLGPGKDLPAISIGARSNLSLGIWTLYSGSIRATGVAVTVFVYDSSTTTSSSARDILPLAQNAFKRLRKLRHPGIATFIDGVMTDSSVFIVTERVTPLVLPTENQLVLLGLYSIAKTLEFLNTECGLVHSNIGQNSILVTEAGEWKLFGMEMLSEINVNQKQNDHITTTNSERRINNQNEYSRKPYHHHNHLPLAHSRSLLLGHPRPPLPPELLQNSSSQIEGDNNNNPFAIDRFMFGSLIAAVSLPGTQLLSDLNTHIQSFTNPRPENRPNYTNILDSPSFLLSPLVCVAKTLETLPTLSERERESFVSQVANAAGAGELPTCYSSCRLIPALFLALEHNTVPSRCLLSLLKISSAYTDTEFATHVVPALIRLWTSTDRALRMILMEHMSKYIDRVDQRVIISSIFPAFAAGYSDSAPALRERTVTATPVLAARIGEKILNGDILRHLARAQSDTEPVIRCNTIVALVILAPSLSVNERRKMIAPALSRALRDGISQVRGAGLRSTLAALGSSTTNSHNNLSQKFIIEADQIANVLLPIISPMIFSNDTPLDQRSLALNVLESSVMAIKASGLVPKLNEENVQNEITETKDASNYTTMQTTPEIIIIKTPKEKRVLSSLNTNNYDNSKIKETINYKITSSGNNQPKVEQKRLQKFEIKNQSEQNSKLLQSVAAALFPPTQQLSQIMKNKDSNTKITTPQPLRNDNNNKKDTKPLSVEEQGECYRGGWDDMDSWESFEAMPVVNNNNNNINKLSKKTNQVVQPLIKNEKSEQVIRQQSFDNPWEF